MSVQLDVQLADDLPEAIEVPPSISELTHWAQAAWQGNETLEPIISLRIVSAAESQQLNNDYRDKNKATNVLSFPMAMDMSMDLDMNMDDNALPVPPAFLMLGDLAICAEIVEMQAQAQHKSRQGHWAHMMVHGVLHLQGYDHIEEDEAIKMESLETHIMQTLGFDDPYRHSAIQSTQPSQVEHNP